MTSSWKISIGKFLLENFDFKTSPGKSNPLLYHKFGKMVIFRSGNVYSLRSPGNQHYQKIIDFFIIKNIYAGLYHDSLIITTNSNKIQLLLCRFSEIDRNE